MRHVRNGLLAVALLTCTSCVPPGGGRDVAGAGNANARSARPSVDAARELDQEGVRSFRAGRFTDAVAYFRAAYQLGGPPSEVWNIVRSLEGMDDLEGASAAIDDYLSIGKLPAQDRADAQREAQALRSRSSTLTVTTTPSGASMTIDGKPAPGTTPLSTDVRPGSHSIEVRLPGYSSVTLSVEGHFGRAVIVTLDLERASK